jgi:nucleoside-diphosphate-sugar epimerase
MKIGVLGATSQIAKDLICSFSTEEDKKLYLFARRPDELAKWLKDVGLSERNQVYDYDALGLQEFDAILNFVGIGNPAEAAAMGPSIFDITLQYDELALNYLRQHPACRYIFLSSGAAYGSSFDAPVNAETKAIIDINKLQPQDWYGVAKLHAECRHRSLIHLSIVDIRVFNYFSSTQDMNARFLITDIMRAINDKSLLKVSSDNIYRDYLHPSDFYQLVCKILAAPRINTAVDCYTQAPIDKINLLVMLHKKFGLRYEFSEAHTAVNATGNKPHYYSLNRRAADFGYLPNFTSLEGVLQEANAQCAKTNDIFGM